MEGNEELLTVSARGMAPGTSLRDSLSRRGSGYRRDEERNAISKTDRIASSSRPTLGTRSLRQVSPYHGVSKLQRGCPISISPQRCGSRP